jgi:hypothetical protein
LKTSIQVNQLDLLDRNILNEIQWCFPLKERPFLEISSHHNISENEVMKRIHNLKQMGLAVHTYESANGYLPPPRGTVNINGTVGSNDASPQALILPYVEQAGKYNQFNFDYSINNPQPPITLANDPNAAARAQDMRTVLQSGHRVGQTAPGVDEKRLHGLLRAGVLRLARRCGA